MPPLRQPGRQRIIAEQQPPLAEPRRRRTVARGEQSPKSPVRHAERTGDLGDGEISGD